MVKAVIVLMLVMLVVVLVFGQNEAREVYKVWHQTPAQNLTARLEVYTTYIGSRYGLSI